MEHIGNYYKAEAYVSHTDSKKGLINTAYHIVRNHTLRSKLNMVQRETGISKGLILDIGAGTGAFLQKMKEAGWQALGLEPDADARENAQKLHGLELIPSHEIYGLSTKFNAITMWHVLEHVHDLQGYVKKIKTLLAPDGKLFIAVPNYTSNDAGKYKENWAAYDVPRHLYHFSPQSLRQLFESNGYKLEKMLPMPFDSYYVSMLSEKIKNAGSQNLVQAMISGFRSNRNAGNEAGLYSSVIYVLSVA